ncbi:MAG TPA: L-histidine N(alpha)-methyltransferase [Thermoanaerobaculia bacterium]|nr:L-histidine N(alpha)-methyltransferase [Thermoanaerobaculia bacterium]
MSERYTLRRVAAGDRTFGDDIRAGLTAARKSIPSRYFYDDLGSALFEAICHLPEYYLTRAEAESLGRSARDIAAAAGEVVRIIELGSGSATKTRMLLDALHPEVYVPVDIDGNVLQKAGRELTAEYPSLRVDAVCGDFSDPARALDGLIGDGRTLVIFLGSTIGNFAPRAATALLRDVRRVLRVGDAFLLGADLAKSKQVLDAAYDDALGITAAFNLNLLLRINRELGAHFDLRGFAHRAFYDEDERRIEMHLVSVREQSVRIDALDVDIVFREGETIHTENSYKYGEDDLARMAAESGFEIAGTYTDSRRLFADVLMRAR